MPGIVKAGKKKTPFLPHNGGPRSVGLLCFFFSLFFCCCCCCGLWQLFSWETPALVGLSVCLSLSLSLSRSFVAVTSHPTIMGLMMMPVLSSCVSPTFPGCKAAATSVWFVNVLLHLCCCSHDFLSIAQALLINYKKNHHHITRPFFTNWWFNLIPATGVCSAPDPVLGRVWNLGVGAGIESALWHLESLQVWSLALTKAEILFVILGICTLKCYLLLQVCAGRFWEISL